MSNLIQEISRRRTFAIISHPDAGKTTRTEKFLLYGGAIAQAHTTEAAGIGTAVEHGRGLTGGNAVVGGLFRSSLAVAVAMDEGHQILGYLDLHTQDLTQLRGGCL